MITYRSLYLKHGSDSGAYDAFLDELTDEERDEARISFNLTNLLLYATLRELRKSEIAKKVLG